MMGSRYAANPSYLLLVVVEKETLVVRRLAVVSRLSSTWIEASEAERADLLN